VLICVHLWLNLFVFLSVLSVFPWLIFLFFCEYFEGRCAAVMWWDLLRYGLWRPIGAEELRQMSNFSGPEPASKVMESGHWAAGFSVNRALAV
jgi:hypothetical protein